MKRFSLLLLLAAAPGFAQVTTQQLVWTPDVSTFNLADCDDDEELVFSWILDGPGISYDTYVVFDPDGECNVADNNVLSPDSGELIPVFENTARPIGPSEQLTDNATKAFFLPTDACFSNEGGRELIGVMCFLVYQTGLTDPASRVHFFEVPVTYDTTAPATPTLANIAASDGSLEFDVEGDNLDDGDVDTVVQLRDCGGGELPTGFTELDGVNPASPQTGDAGVPCEGNLFERVENGLDITVGGLDTTATYEFRVVLVDDFGNRGGPTEMVAFAPISELGPLGNYDGQGTPYSFTPDCSQAGTVPLFAALSLLSLFLFRRRRALVLVLALAVPSVANADVGDVTADLFAAPLLTDLDKDPGANGLYKCFYGDQTVPEIGFDVTFRLFEKFGSLEAGIGLQAAQVTGVTFDAAVLANDPSCNTPTEGGRSQLTVLKLVPQLAYRFDYLLDEFDIPLVPYGEVGLVASGYSFTRNRKFDDGGPSDAGPVGAVFGYHAVLGLALELSFLDAIDPFTPNTAKRARARGSFLHPFFFTELALQDIDNFGGGGFVFSPRDVLLGTGLPMTVRFGVRIEL